MNRIFVLTALLPMLAACGDWPDLGEAVPRADAGGWPMLIPLSDLPQPPESSTDPDAEARRLLARAASLRARAALLRTPVPDDAAFESLRARIAG
jgi:hypothetical protein